MMTQTQMFWEAHRQVSDTNITFMMMVKDGMTSQDLQKLIDKRPSLWARFNHWVTKLP